jgi:plasmid stabilization system protein ParE
VTRRFKLTPEARLDLLSIWKFIARDDINAADRVITRLETAFQLLGRFPRKGHKRNDVHTSEPVLFWPVSSYVVVYRPEPRPVLIVRVFHGARDLDALL